MHEAFINEEGYNHAKKFIHRNLTYIIVSFQNERTRNIHDKIHKGNLNTTFYAIDKITELDNDINTYEQDQLNRSVRIDNVPINFTENQINKG